MAIEARRGCGYRKVGGLYMVSDKYDWHGCCKMPIILHICPTCNQGIKQSRGWQWIYPKPWIEGTCSHIRPMCPLNSPHLLGDRVGLLWVGTQFYPSPDHFALEVKTMGLSKRIKAVPRGFKLGETWVFLAHPHTMRAFDGSWIGGVFQVVRPTKIEKLITENQSKEPDVLDDLIRRGINPIVVPDNDPDHQGSVYDKGE